MATASPVSSASPTYSLRMRALTFLPMLGVGYGLALSRWPLHLPPVCGFKMLTGLPCPGCGMTHACCALANGHLVDALHFNLSVVPFAVATGTICLAMLLELALDRPVLGPIWRRNRRWFLWSLAFVVPVAWAVNLFGLWP